MSKGFLNIITLIFLAVLTVVSLIIEKNILTAVDIKVNKLKSEYEEIKNENKELSGKLEMRLSMQELQKIAEEKNFSKPDKTDIKKVVFINLND